MNGNWNLLLVDDDEDDYVLVGEWLSSVKSGNFRLTWADSYTAALDLLETNRYDAALIDYDLGGRNGLDLTNEIVRRGYGCPTIMLTGRGGYEIDLGAMKAGAIEYLAKGDTTPRLLERTIRYAIEHHRNLDALQQANEQLSLAREELELRVQERTRELEKYTRRLEALARLSQDLAPIGRDQAGVMATVTRQIVDWLGDTCTITLLSEDGRWLQDQLVYHPDPQAQEFVQTTSEAHPYPVGEGVSGRVAQTGKVVRIEQVDREKMRAAVQPKYAEYIDRFPMYSLLVAPMRGRERVIGTIGVSRIQPGRPYTPEDESFLLEIGERTALALENARLFSRAEQELAERRRAEGALRESQALFERLFESSPDPTLLLDKDGLIRQVNQQTVQAFGYSAAELVGTPFTRLLAERFHRVFSEYLDEAARRPDGRPYRLDIDIAGCRQDNREFPIEVVQGPFRLASSAGYICVVHDITLRKRMEAELAEVPRRLLAGVEAERLRLAKELHDGPIQEMYGVAFGLRSISAELGASDFQSLMRIEKMLKRLYENIQNMRDISRFLRPPTLSPFGLEATIRSQIDNFREQRPEIEVTLDLQPDAQYLPEAVRLVLYRIFQNAMSNAVRHANATQVTVRLRLDDDAATLEVEDDGRGFEFDGRFVDFVRRGHMGLAGSNEHAEAIGARMEVITTPGSGTLVRVVAPLKIPAGEPSAL